MAAKIIQRSKLIFSLIFPTQLQAKTNNSINANLCLMESHLFRNFSPCTSRNVSKKNPFLSSPESSCSLK